MIGVFWSALCCLLLLLLLPVRHIEGKYPGGSSPCSYSSTPTLDPNHSAGILRRSILELYGTTVKTPCSVRGPCLPLGEMKGQRALKLTSHNLILIVEVLRFIFDLLAYGK